MGKVHFQPHDKAIEVRDGMTFLQTANQAKVLLKQKCGGKGACATCKVQVTHSDGELAALTPMEVRMLNEKAIKDGFRLACQIKVNGDAEITVPEDPLRRAVRLQLEAAERERQQQGN
jgi:ferredoxin, 2Fe-2S